MKKANIITAAIVVVVLTVIGIWMVIYEKEKKPASETLCEQPINRDLEHIAADGKLVALIDFSPTSYFVYKGIPMGFHYDMLKDLAEHLGLQLEVKVETDIARMLNMLNKGEVDVIAMDLAISLSRKQLVSFVNPHLITRQMLVQRLPDDFQTMSTREIEQKLVRSLLELRKKEIYIPSNTSYNIRLQHIQEETGGKIDVITRTGAGVEQLIEMVAKGEIDYTICDEHLANIEKSYYRNIDVETPISFDQEVAWAVRKTSPTLLDAINVWQKRFMQSRKYSFLVKKYIQSSRSSYLMRADFNSAKGGKISEYDKLIRKHAKLIDWDWRLLASLIYQESNFKHELTSWAGAWGLMQLMPQTSITFGADSFAGPEENIMAGVRFIKWMDSNFPESIAPEEKLKFILASYNVGMGHILDARRLAEKYGKNPDLWEDNTALYLELKSQPKYYLDPVVKSGFCRGHDVVEFVNEVLTRYNHYLNVVKE